MSIRLTFGCGHVAVVPIAVTQTPICPTCGDARVQRVKSRQPSFLGACTGPFAEYKALEPVAVSVAPKGSLTLKAPE